MLKIGGTGLATRYGGTLARGPTPPLEANAGGRTNETSTHQRTCLDQTLSTPGTPENARPPKKHPSRSELPTSEET